MELLQRECWFRSEVSASTSTVVDVTALAAYVARGRTSLSTVALRSGRTVDSVSVKDASQGDVAGLPCGARSLLVDKDTGAIVCRGVNKFFDFGEVSDGWRADRTLWTSPSYTVWAVRKMAGFIVTIFSLDGVELEVMSKHVLEGPHVDMARELLQQWSPETRARVAATLFEYDASASLECIHSSEDLQHPVLEAADFDEQLVLLTVQKRRQRREVTLPCSEVKGVAESWGVMCTPMVQLTDSAGLQEVFEAASSWERNYSPFGVHARLAEGFVLVIEVAAPCDNPPSPQWTYPIRLKLKTATYVVLRAFRSLVMGDSRPATHAYHAALVGWLQPKGPQEIRAMVAESGVFSLHSRIEAAMQSKTRLRHRGASRTVAGALSELHALASRTAGICVTCPLTVLVFCGLPGAGKSTLCRSLVEHSVAQDGVSSPYAFVVHLSRDETTVEVAARHGIDETSSKHKQRRLRAMVHQQLSEDMRTVAQFCQETGQAGLLMLDACHATRASRHVWRTCFPTSMRRYQIVHVDCSDPAVVSQRAGLRAGHEVLRSAADAQQALYAVRQKFQPPTVEEEKRWYVDTSASTPAAATAVLCDQLTHLQQDIAATDKTSSSSDRKGRTRRMTVKEMQAECQQERVQLLIDLLGITAEVAENVVNVTAFFTVATQKPHAQWLRVRLQTPMEALREVAACVLSTSLSSEAVRIPSLAATGLQLVRRVTAAWWSSAAPLPSSITAHLTRGQVKWLQGWLLHGKADTSTEAVASALKERFECKPAVPHVTLLYPSAAEEGSMEQFLTSHHLRLGEGVTVHLRSLLMDRHALCLGVELNTGLCTQGGAAPTPVPLHVTLGTADGVPAAYAGGMAHTFEAWQQENVELQVEQASSERRVARSQRKFHNFVKYALDTEVLVRGVVETAAA